MTDEEIQLIRKKKRYLKRYRKNVSCIERLERKLFVLTQRMESTRSPTFSDEPKGGNAVTMSDLMCDKVELEERIAMLKEKTRTLKKEILSEIDKLEDYRYCEVLEAHFIDGLTFSDIADMTGYTERHIYSLYKEAIRLLSL